MRFVGGDISTSHIDRKRPRPLIVFDSAGLAGRNENTGRDDNGVQTAVCQHHAAEHAGYARTVGEVTCEPDGRSAAADAGPGNANTVAMPGENFLCGLFCRYLV